MYRPGNWVSSWPSWQHQSVGSEGIKSVGLHDGIFQTLIRSNCIVLLKKGVEYLWSCQLTTMLSGKTEWTSSVIYEERSKLTGVSWEVASK
jgi:hypothetical protein